MDMKASELGCDQVDEEHQPDRGTAQKGKPAGEFRGAEDGHGKEVGERHLRDPAIEILLLHLRQVLLVLRERADKEQEDAGEKHHHRDLERTGRPQGLPGCRGFHVARGAAWGTQRRSESVRGETASGHGDGSVRWCGEGHFQRIERTNAVNGSRSVRATAAGPLNFTNSDVEASNGIMAARIAC